MSESIFISYRRDDAAGFARALHTSICQRFHKRNVFMDVDAIEPGLDFVKAIENAVGDCSVLLAVIGAKWLEQDKATGKPRIDNSNDYVRVEIATALQRNIRVIPILVQNTPMPGQEELPEDLQPLTRRNALSLSNERFEEDMQRLFKVLGKHIDLWPPKSGPVSLEIADVTPPTTGPEPPKPTVPDTKKYHWGAALLSLVGFVIAGPLLGGLAYDIAIYSGLPATEVDTYISRVAISVWVLGLFISLRVWRRK